MKVCCCWSWNSCACAVATACWLALIVWPFNWSAAWLSCSANWFWLLTACVVLGLLMSCAFRFSWYWLVAKIEGSNAPWARRTWARADAMPTFSNRTSRLFASARSIASCKVIRWTGLPSKIEMSNPALGGVSSVFLENGGGRRRGLAQAEGPAVPGRGAA